MSAQPTAEQLEALGASAEVSWHDMGAFWQHHPQEALDILHLLPEAIDDNDCVARVMGVFQWLSQSGHPELILRQQPDGGGAYALWGVFQEHFNPGFGPEETRLLATSTPINGKAHVWPDLNEQQGVAAIAMGETLSIAAGQPLWIDRILQVERDYLLAHPELLVVRIGVDWHQMSSHYNPRTLKDEFKSAKSHSGAWEGLPEFLQLSLQDRMEACSDHVSPFRMMEEEDHLRATLLTGIPVALSGQAWINQAGVKASLHPSTQARIAELAARRLDDATPLAPARMGNRL